MGGDPVNRDGMNLGRKRKAGNTVPGMIPSDSLHNMAAFADLVFLH
jgi:hypothetical protein